jgi:hypothetical protein
MTPVNTKDNNEPSNTTIHSYTTFIGVYLTNFSVYKITLYQFLTNSISIFKVYTSISDVTNVKNVT